MCTHTERENERDTKGGRERERGDRDGIRETFFLNVKI